MSAFGDGLLFLLVYSVVAVFPTGTGLYVLRPYDGFWRYLSGVVALAVATGVLAVSVYVGQRSAEAGSLIHDWSAIAVLRIFVAPLFAGLLLVSGLFAPSRGYCLVLLSATFIEAVEFMAMFVLLNKPFITECNA